MSEHFHLMISDVDDGPAKADVTAPYDESLIATASVADWDAVDRALSTAQRLFSNRDSWLPPPERLEILKRAAAAMQSRREELALEAAREGGKPLKDSLVETDRAIDGLHCCVEALRTQAGTEVPMRVNEASANRYASTYFEPIGPVVAYSAFNHPINLIIHQVAPAIAAGCPVLVKPAEATPLSCFRVVEIFRNAGLPEAFCQAFLSEDHDVSGKLASDPRVAFLTFIGSARVGWMLRSKLAPGTRCALEHGGVAPVIMAKDARLDDAIGRLTKAGFYHAGQVCVSVQRVYADRTIARDVANRLATEAGSLIVGDPTLPETDVGPLIRPGEVDRVHEWVEEAAGEGGEVLCGGKRKSSTCYEPTVLFDPPDAVRASTQEIFGPVVCVYPFDDLDEALTRANDTPFAFQAAVFTEDLDTAFRASRRLNASTVTVNDHTAFRVDWMPFAGLRASGLGIGGIPFTMHDMQIEKMVVFRSQEL